MERHPIMRAVFLSAVILGLVGSSAAWAEVQYKVVPDRLAYTLNITSDVALESHFGGVTQQRAKVVRKHEDHLGLTQTVTTTDSGALDVALIFDRINTTKKPVWQYEGGSEYARRDIVGAAHHTLIDTRGKVREVQAVPHFASQLFHDEVDGAPLDIYRALLFLYPRFPDGGVAQGTSWEVEDEVTVGAGQMPPINGLPPRAYEVDVTAKWKAKYTWIDTVMRKGYRTARIGFEASFTTQGEGHSATAGIYTKGRGTSSGEIFFAVEKGFVVDALITSKVKEIKAEDGRTVVQWLTPKEMIFLNLQGGQTTVPLTWLTDQRVELTLVPAKEAKQ